MNVLRMLERFTKVRESTPSPPLSVSPPRGERCRYLPPLGEGQKGGLASEHRPSTQPGLRGYFAPLIALVATLALLAALACSPKATATPTGPAVTPTPSPTPTGVPTKVKLGLLPIVDSLPFYVADQEGYFKDEGLQVEFTTFASALERDTAIQTGQTDGQLADLIATGLLNNGVDRVRIVETTYDATPQRAMIGIVAMGNSGVNAPADLKGKRIGISENSLIDYITTELLKAAGMTDKDVQRVTVPNIAVRMQMLTSGQLDAATLPDPFLTLALQSGGHMVTDDSAQQIGLSVLEFRKEWLDKNGDVARKLVRAHDKAVEAIAASPEKYRALLVEKARVPDQVKDTFPVPSFPTGQVPSDAAVKRAVAWMVYAGLVPSPSAVVQMVDGSYVQ